MRAKDKLRRAAALVMAGAMTLGVVPGMGVTMEAWADTATAQEPSVTAYATKAQMMGDTFKPTTVGGAEVNIGKIVLGKRDNDQTSEHSLPLEWYILGADSGVNDGNDNTIIFAAEYIKTHIVFNGNSSYDQYFNSEKHGTYESDVTPTNVYPNHYGISNLRVVMNRLATASQYFTTAEQKLMQPTKVTTEDYKNRNEGAASKYTTSDVLYAAGANTTASAAAISVGSTGHSVSLEATQYWPKGYWFWLRTPAFTNGTDGNSPTVMIAQPDEEKPYLGYVRPWADSGGGVRSVRPASNLNLSSVLFASAAVAASSSDAEAGVIANGAAMTLRLDPTEYLKGEGDDAEGSGFAKKVGTATYDSKTKTITVALDGNLTTGEAMSPDTVTLVVQGANKAEGSGTATEWYFSKQITSDGSEGSGTGMTTIAADEIVKKLTESNPAVINGMTVDDLDLTKCRIWIETPVDENSTLAFANLATEHTHEFGSEWDYDSEGHWKKCTNGCPYTTNKWTSEGEQGKEDHTYGTASGSEDICTVCGFNRKCKHNESGETTVVKVSPQPATCTQAGQKGYYKCSSCHKVWTDMLTWVEINDLDEWIVNNKEPALGHSFSGNKCTRCGYTKPDSSDSDSDDPSDDPSDDSSEDPSKDSSKYSSDDSGDAGRRSDSDDSSDDSGYTGRSGGSSSGYGYGHWIQMTAETAGTDVSRIGQWRFLFNNGKYAAGSRKTSADGITTEYVGWAKIGGEWFAFDADGFMVTDWVYDASDGNWYFCDEDHGMMTGWHQDAVDGRWYYLDTVSGAMYIGWHTIDGNKYFFSQEHNGSYYFDETLYKWVYDNTSARRPLGSLYQNELTPDGSPVNENGEAVNR